MIPMIDDDGTPVDDGTPYDSELLIEDEDVSEPSPLDAMEADCHE